MKDNQMSRGASQALYKYLPDSWIDFSMRGKTRKNYIANVVRWNSEQLVDVNKARLIRLVDQSVRGFEALAGPSTQIAPTSGFGSELTPQNCDVLTPKAGGEEREIIAEVSPLTFYCKECKKVYQFSDYLHYVSSKGKCKACNIELSQLRQIYFHRCGFASDRHNIFCPKCKNSNNIRYNGKYEFVCGTCKTSIQMNKKCDCGTMLGPKVALDPSQYFSFSLSFIDLINESDEKFISKTDYGAFAIILHWLGKITDEEFLDIKQKGIVSNLADYEKVLAKFMELFKTLPEPVAKMSAELAAKNECGNKYDSMINDLKVKLTSPIDDVKRFAEMLI